MSSPLSITATIIGASLSLGRLSGSRSFLNAHWEDISPDGEPAWVWNTPSARGWVVNQRSGSLNTCGEVPSPQSIVAQYSGHGGSMTTVGKVPVPGPGPVIR